MNVKEKKKLTNEQIEQAQQMHEAGITYAIIATYFKVCTTTLRKQMKHYEND